MMVSFIRPMALSAFACAGVSAAALVSSFVSSEALATNYTCQADLVVRGGQIISSSIGDGFSQRQACQNAMNQCQSDLDTLQQQGQYRYAACRINYGNGPVTPVPGPGPFPPNPGPFPPTPGPFPPYPGNSFEISCSSYGYDVNYCYVGSFAYDVRLISQYSDAACRKNRSFGLQGEYLWVTEGCRGTFAIFSR